MGRDRTPEHVKDAIIDLVLLGYTPPEIGRRLADVDRPSLRTIQRIARRVRLTDKSGPWRIDDMSPADARIVLDFMAEVLVASEGRITHIMHDAARWVVLLRTLCPVLSVGETARLVMLYQYRRENSQGTHTDLDAFLAFRPWESHAHAVAYKAAKDAGHIKPEPSFLRVHLI